MTNETRLLAGTLAVYTAVVVTKVHETVPAIGALQPGKIVALLLIGFAAFILTWREMYAVLSAPPVKWVAIIVVLAVCSAPFGVWPGYTFQFLKNEFWKTILFFLIAAAAMANRQTLVLCIKVVVGCAVLLAIRLIGGSAPLLEGRSFISTAFDPNESALLFLVVIPLALYLGTRRDWWRYFGYGAALLLVAGIVQTSSRGGFLGMVVLGAWLIYRAHGKRRLVYVAAVAASAVIFIVTANQQTRERFTSIFAPSKDYNYTTRDGRVQVWKRGMKYMIERPVLGVGARNFPIAEGMLSGKRNEGYGIKYSAAHNSFVEIGAELGVLGLLGFVSMLWSAARGCTIVLKTSARLRSNTALVENETALAHATRDAVLAFIVPAFFLSFAYHPVTFFLIAMCIAVRIGSPLVPVIATTPSTRRARPRYVRTGMRV